MAEYLVKDTSLTAVANAIREKAGLENSFAFPDGFVQAIEEISAGADTSVEDSIVSRTISGAYTNNNVTNIGSNAFNGCSRLTSVNFPAATSIGSSAFMNCRGLTSINSPAVTTIGSDAFGGCSALTSVNFPAATSIGNSAFQSCSALTTANFPAATSIGNSAFYFCSALTSVNFPAATSIGSYAFMNCSALTTANFPAVTSIGNSAFGGCTNLISIYLANSSVCTLAHSNAFSNTGIWSTKGSIFVPTSLVASYKVARNWSYFSNCIFGI